MLVIISKVRVKDFIHKLKSLKSIRVVLLLMIMAAGIVPLLILTKGAIYFYTENAKSELRKEVRSYSSIISNTINSTGFINSQSVENIQGNNSASSELDTIASVFGGRVIIVDSNFIIIKDTYNKETGNFCISPEVTKCLADGNESILSDNGYVQIILPIRSVEENQSVSEPKTYISGVMILSYSENTIDISAQRMAGKMWTTSMILIAIVVTFAIISLMRIMGVFRKFRKALGRLTEGYIDEKVAVNDYREFAAMSETINNMMNRLNQLEKSRQEFVSNVSHELKTPITSMKVLADSLTSQESVPAEVYREFMVDIANEIDRENKIITDLLSMVRLDKSADSLNVSKTNINELLEILLKRIRPIAKERNIEIVFESFRPVEAEIDDVKLALAFSNLIENAVKYNQDDGWVKVTLNADHKFFYVKVADSGVGIPQDCQDHIFDRFYRVDKARSRETGGTGLGLSITRSVVLLHKGAIKVYSKEKEGTTFTVRIPLNYSK